jgi:hypothetical protein
MAYKKIRSTNKKNPILAATTANELRKLLSKYKDDELITIMLDGGIAIPVITEKPNTTPLPNIEVVPPDSSLPEYKPPRHPNPKAPTLFAPSGSYRLHAFRLSKRIRPSIVRLYVRESETQRK